METVCEKYNIHIFTFIMDNIRKLKQLWQLIILKPKLCGVFFRYLVRTIYYELPKSPSLRKGTSILAKLTAFS